jgi:hypothetical protein
MKYIQKAKTIGLWGGVFTLGVATMAAAQYLLLEGRFIV